MGKRESVKALWALLALLSAGLFGCGRSAALAPASSEIARRSAAAGFLAAKVEESKGFISGADQKGQPSDCAYLYDNALAVIALVYSGAQEHAEKIADCLVFAQEHDRRFKDGRLRNAYIAGDPRSDSGRSIAAGRVTVRLPGFWQRTGWQEEFYTVSTSAGNMAWATLALCAAAEKASAEKKASYLEAAVRAADFVLSLETENGGFAAGYEGWDEVQTKAAYLSTEHNLDLYRSFLVLSEAVCDSEPEKAKVYRKAAKTAKQFVLSMYDEERGCFYAGTTDDGKTVSNAVIPLDTNSLSILALGEELADAYQVLAFVEEHMAVGDGFDFGDGDLDGIWNEGTAQMAVCYDVLNDKERYDALMAYLDTQTDGDGSLPAADRDGVSTGFVIAGTDIFWEYGNVQSISATAWLAFAQLAQNPLGNGGDERWE